MRDEQILRLEEMAVFIVHLEVKLVGHHQAEHQAIVVNAVAAKHALGLDRAKSLEDFMQKSQNLTVEQVRDALNKHLAADKMVIVTAGPKVAQQPLPPPTDKPAEQPLGVPEH